MTPALAAVLLSGACLGIPAPAPHGDLHERIAEVSARIGATPRVASLYVERADLHRRHGDHDEALADLSRAEALEGELLSIPFIRALVALDQKRPQAALEWAERILEREPTHGGAEEIRFRCRLATHEYAAAFESVERLLASDLAPRPDLFALYARERALRGDDGVTAALAILERGLLRSPGHPELERNAQALEVRAGNWAAAEQRLQRRVARERADLLWEEWAETNAAAGRKAAALEAAERALATWKALPPRVRARPVEQTRGERLALLIEGLQP